MLEKQQNKLAKEFGRVGVLYGGNNAEREVSLRSGDAVYDALIKNNVDAIKIDTKENILEQVLEQKITRAFIVLHGRDGEDGVVQGFLSCMNIPFTGSDTASSALAMNKAHSKNVARSLKIDTAPFELVEKHNLFVVEDAEKIVSKLGLPVFVKPIREGSSVGMSKATTVKELVDAVEFAQKYDVAMIEKFIAGREYTVTILNGQALPSISMVTPNDFYDYQAKYHSKETQYFCPSGLNDSDEKELQTLALKAFNALGCSGWGRVDFIRDETSSLFMLLEVNTVPGMTNTSLVPKAAEASGLSYEQLVMSILQGSYENEMNSSAMGDAHG